MTILSAIECIDNDKTWTMSPFILKWDGGEVDLSPYIQGKKMTMDDVVSTKKNSPFKTKTNRLASGWASGFVFPQHYQLDNFKSTLLQHMKLAARNCGFELCVLNSRKLKSHVLKTLGCEKARVYTGAHSTQGGILKANITDGKRQPLGKRKKSDPRATSTSYADSLCHTCPFHHIKIGYFFDERIWVLKMNDNQTGCNYMMHKFHSFVPPQILAGSKLHLQEKSVCEDSKLLSEVNSTEGQIANFLSTKYDRTYTPQDVNLFLRNLRKQDGPTSHLNPSERLVNHLRARCVCGVTLLSVLTDHVNIGTSHSILIHF